MTTRLVFNARTLVWSVGSNGLIVYKSAAPHTGYNTTVPYPSPAYECVLEMVAYDPVNQTGGSFYRLLTGPDTGKFVSWRTNVKLWGSITVTEDASGCSGPNTASGYYPNTGRDSADLSGAVTYSSPGFVYPTVPTAFFAGGWASPLWWLADAAMLPSGHYDTCAPASRAVNEVRLHVLMGGGKMTVYTHGTGTVSYSIKVAGSEVVESTGTAPVGTPFDVVLPSDCHGHYVAFKLDAGNGTALGFGGFNWHWDGADTPDETTGGYLGSSTDFAYTNVDPLADWRILIKGLGVTGAAKSPTTVTINQATNRYTRTAAGIIRYEHPRLRIQAGGPYRVEPIIVPYDPIRKTGGSFWKMLDGPYPGWLLSTFTNQMGYGDITILNEPVFGHGPGPVIATLHHPNAHLAGFSINYNSPGELHFTLLVDDPNIRVVLPKKTHATVEFWNSTTLVWDEVWAGMIWDQDASDTETVFLGVDYLGLLQYSVDERFDPMAPEKSEPAGAKYVDKTIKYIVDAQLDYAIGLSNSLVGWITRGATAAMNEKITIFSVMQQTLPFVIGLINSHRSGTGIFTRLFVRKTVAGGYEFVVEDDPGVNRDDKIIRYGSLAQGYRVIQFGAAWASRVNMIARSATGTSVLYRSDNSGISQAEWGRIGQGAVMVTIDDKNDLIRRAKQAALDAARMGQQIGPGLKLGSFRPLDGYDLCDNVPIEINHGSVNTKDWGSDVFGSEASNDPSTVRSNYWTILGIKWESYDDGHWMTSLSLFPKGGGIIPVTTCSLAASEAAGAHALSPPYAGTVALTPTISPAVLLSFLLTNDRDWDPKVSVPATPAGFTSLLEVPWTSRSAYRISYRTVKEPSGAYSTPFTFTPGYGGGGGWIAELAAIQTAATAPVQSAHAEGSGGCTLPASPTPGNMLVMFGLSAAFNGDCFPNTYPAGWKRIAYEKISASQTDLQAGIWVKCVNAGDTRTYELGKSGGYGSDIGIYVSEWAIKSGLEGSDPVRNPVPSTSGWGPPPPETTSDTYIDLGTGITYKRNDDTGTYDPVVGTGSVVDFTFAASTQWVINHTMGGYPRATLRDVGGTVIDAEIVYTSTAIITVNFSSAVAGSAHLG